MLVPSVMESRARGSRPELAPRGQSTRVGPRHRLRGKKRSQSKMRFRSPRKDVLHSRLWEMKSVKARRTGV
ncbi:hypothetical protein BC826DRAFT_1059602 [Russula brevipes]|nr:hypothetical protein BC826DRAFT_1059602 [Russula brevipes]